MLVIRPVGPLRPFLLVVALLLCASRSGVAQTVIDPPPGGPFADPPTLPNTSTTPGVVDVSLEAKIAPVNVNGVTADLMTYNGAYPGPLIRVKQGDTLHVHLRNSLPVTTEKNLLGFTRNRTNLHLHGMHVSPEEPADDVGITILPAGTDTTNLPPSTYSGSYDFVYDLSKQEPGCLNFYHTHSHGLVAEQYWSGLVGPLVVEDPPAVSLPYETHILVLKDITLSGNVPEPHASTTDYLRGKEGSTVMVNGQVNPVLAARPGQVQRWRVLNASNARFYKLSLEQHVLNVIGTDGGLLDKPYPQETILLSPGERVDILVAASATAGNYRLLALPYARLGNYASARITLMTMSVQGTVATDTLPTTVNPAAARLNIDTPTLPKKTFVLSMGASRAYINGNDFDLNPDTTASTLGGYEVWEITNQNSMDHPFHQHINAAQVLAISGGDPAYSAFYTTAPAWKDTVLVPKNGSVTLLVPVRDWTGSTMYHCHIVEHEDIGMMGMWNISGTPAYTFADAARALQIAGGMAAGGGADVERLDVVKDPAPTVDRLDAVGIARKAAGLDPNP